jgi:hypothetical protein
MAYVIGRIMEIGRLPSDTTQVMRLKEIKALLVPDRIEVALPTVIEVRSSGSGWADHGTVHLPSCLGRVDSAARHHRKQQLHDQRSFALRPRPWLLLDIKQQQ